MAESHDRSSPIGDPGRDKPCPYSYFVTALVHNHSYNLNFISVGFNLQNRLLLERKMMQPLVGVIMGSKSDWETMSHTAQTLEALGIPFEVRVVSAHRTPDLLFEYAATAELRGLEVIIAGAGGAAHLPGMTSAKTVLPVLGVPVESKSLSGVDSLLSIVQMPAGIAVGTLAIGRSGAVNAALMAAAILGIKHARFRDALRAYREKQTETVLAHPDPREQQ